LPDQADLVRNAYLDEDNLAAAKRFEASEEFAEILALLKSNFSKSPPWSVLDIGAGNGIAAYAFAKAGHKVFALEPDPSSDVGAGAIKRLMESSNLNIEVINCAAEAVPLANETIDLVYVRQALHHAESLTKLLQEAYRVLKSGGCLLATREHVIDNEEQLKVFLVSHPLHKWYGGENAYKLGEYLNSIKKAGFELISVLGPFDSVINYFPMSRYEFDKKAIQYIRKRLGRYLGDIIGSSPIYKKWYGKLLSWRSKTPGRLYSFLARKI
jgi:ubiquinone/menaquinone biosynthesis C-methylase UbiE